MNLNKKSYREGVASEKSFSSLAIEKGFFVEKSSKNQDIYDHIDYFLFKDNRRVSVDVKARKRDQRYGNYADNYVWIELVNVRGNSGWLNGKQDLVAFEFEDNYIVVNRISLNEYIYSTIDFNLPYVNSPKDAAYRLYQRKGRKDLITKIKKEDLFKLKYRIWNKK